MLLAVSPGLYLGLGCALSIAFLFGVADFGTASMGKKMSPMVLSATLYIQEVPLLFLIVISTRKFGTTSNDLALFAIGILGACAFTSLVYGLSRGHVSIIMALLGLLSLIVPAIVSVVIGEHSSWLIWVGLAVSAVAIVCITQAPKALESEDHRAQGRALNVAIAIGCFTGIAFGFYNAGLGHIGAPIAMKLLMLQSPGFIGALVYIFVKRPNFAPVRKLWFITISMSLAYNIAQFLFPIASSRVSLMVTNIIVNLYPGLTIVLSKIFSNEKTSRTQNIGFAVAVVGLILVTVGVSS